MRQDPPKRKLRRLAAETDSHDPSESVGDTEGAGTARPANKRGRHPVRQSDSQGSSEVGYGRPPKHSQFKPGLSGNSKGRPPQTRNFKTIVNKVLNEQVQLREGGKVRRMPKIEALFRTVMSRAFKGDPKFMASFLVMLKQGSYGIEATELSAELLQDLDHQAVLKEFLVRSGLEEPTGSNSSADNSADRDGTPKTGKA